MEDWMNKKLLGLQLVGYSIDAAITFLEMQAKSTGCDNYRNFDQVMKSIPMLHREITS